MEKKKLSKESKKEIKQEVKKLLAKKQPKKTAQIKRWFVVDARGKVIGRLASKVATVLLGKNKVSFLPYLDSGDYVIVINAAKIASTGNKEEKKIYYRYSGYPGGLKERTLKTLRSEKPEMVVKHAVAGMLPKTKLGKAVIKKLYVYSGEKHPHEAQKAEELEV